MYLRNLMAMGTKIAAADRSRELRSAKSAAAARLAGPARVLLLATASSEILRCSCPPAPWQQPPQGRAPRRLHRLPAGIGAASALWRSRRRRDRRGRRLRRVGSAPARHGYREHDGKSRRSRLIELSVCPSVSPADDAERRVSRRRPGRVLRRPARPAADLRRRMSTQSWASRNAWLPLPGRSAARPDAVVHLRRRVAGGWVR